MAKKYNCPKCGCEVGMGNINVEKDILLCSSCGETSRFSEIIDLEREAEEEDSSRRLLNSNPPKHLKVISDPTDMTGRISLIYRKFSPTAFVHMLVVGFFHDGDIWLADRFWKI